MMEKLREIRRLRYYMKLYDAMMSRLTPEQAGLVTARYMDGLSLNRVLRALPEGVKIQSKTTVSKRCSEALRLLDQLLANTQYDIPEAYERRSRQ